MKRSQISFKKIFVIKPAGKNLQVIELARALLSGEARVSTLAYAKLTLSSSGNSREKITPSRPPPHVRYPDSLKQSAFV